MQAELQLTKKRMNHQLSKIICAAVLTAGIFSCSKKSSDSAPPAPPQFQAITFKFGTDATPITADNATMIIKNMPRSCDVTQLGASAVLPAGYSISPDPSTSKDYTKGVTYTIQTGKGSYTIQITAPGYNAVSNPWGIYTPKQLSDVRNGLNDSYVLINDIQLPDLSAANAASDVGISDYKDYGWYSIGTRYVNGGNVIFRGSLDGQNHVIKNLASNYRGNNLPNGIDAGHNGKDGDGLFGNAVAATFKNIGIQLAAAGMNDFTVGGDGYGNVASLVGLADSCTVANCYVTGNSVIKGGQFTAGLIGKISNSSITKSYAALTSAAGTYSITSGNDGGGLIGWALRCDVTDCSASASVVGVGNIAGLIGTVNTCNIKTSYASGNISELPMNTSSSLVASNNLGGLIGSISSISPSISTIQNCYATGSVAGGNGSNTDFHKGTRIGGLVGQTNTISGLISISYCYASGQISRTWTNATAPFLTGGLAGNTTNSVFTTSGACTNYWDKTTTSQTVLGGGNGALAQDNAITANGKTTAEMKSSATFSNWDFSAVWNVAVASNNGYPYLRTVAK
jgi:hypothetical protein